MIKITVYKKLKGCPNCAVLERLLPKVKPSLEGVQWDEVVFDEENPVELPEFVKAFPTSSVEVDGTLVGTVAGYDKYKEKINELLN